MDERKPVTRDQSLVHPAGGDRFIGDESVCAHRDFVSESASGADGDWCAHALIVEEARPEDPGIPASRRSGFCSVLPRWQ